MNDQNCKNLYLLNAHNSSRLNWFSWKGEHMSPNQYGFRPQTSTIDAIEDLIEYIEELNKKNKVLVISLDVSGAFDCAQLIDILNAVKSMDCPPNLIRLLEDCLKCRTVQIETMAGCVQKEQRQGACQGSVSGPLLWNILFDELLQKNFGPNVRLQAFADDLIVVVGLSRQAQVKSGRNSVNETVKDLTIRGNEILKELHNWGLKKKIAFNPSKTKAMVYKTNFKKINSNKLRMNGEDIQLSEDLKALGVVIDNKMKFGKHIEENCMKATSLITRISPMLTNLWGIKPDARQILSSQVIEPTMTYGLSIAPDRCQTTRNLEKLNRAQRTAMSRIASGYRTAGHQSLTAITGSMPIAIRVQELAIHRKIRKGRLSAGRKLEGPLTECIKGMKIRTDINYFERDFPYNWTKIHENMNVNAQVTIATDLKCSEELYTVSFGCYFGGRPECDAVSYSINCSETDVLFKGIYKGLQWVREKLPSKRTSGSIAVFVGKPYLIQMINKFNSLNRIVNDIHQLIKDEFRGFQIELTRETRDNQINEGLKADLKSVLNRQRIREEKLPFDPKKLKVKVREKALDLWQNWWEPENCEWGAHTRQFIPNIRERLKWKHFEPSFILTQYITDHGKFGDYLEVRKWRSKKDCIYCEKSISGTVDNAKHRLQDCEGTAALRQENGWLYTNGAINWGIALKTKENYKKFLKLVNRIDSEVFKDLWIEENAQKAAKRQQLVTTN